MLRHTRPAEAANFQAHVHDAKAQINDIIKAGGIPKSKDFDDKWGKFKPDFANAQHNKCAYCDLDVTAGQPGDVEHFAPKTNVTELVSRGVETASSASLSGRAFHEVSSLGYWWLAYDWTNYLLSCRICNSPWKMNLFPVSDGTPNWPPTLENPNATLLLNPFDDDPVLHLRFTPDGAIEPRDNSAMAKATIATCGLDRIALTYRRRKLAMRVHRLAQGLVARLNETPPNNTEIKNLAERLVEVGDATEILAGMVRAIVYEYLDVPWQNIEALANP